MNGLKIFDRAYQFCLQLYRQTMSFPKSQRFVIVQKVQVSALELLTSIVEANTLRNKKEALNKADGELQKLKILLRLSHDLRYLDMKKYETLSQVACEIGRMMGGWKKWADEKSG